MVYCLRTCEHLEQHDSYSVNTHHDESASLLFSPEDIGTILAWSCLQSIRKWGECHCLGWSRLRRPRRTLRMPSNIAAEDHRDAGTASSFRDMPGNLDKCPEY
ncbi:hypothetical protein AcV7_005702 [Taiwanofungus camphoratus]|nr:hypothetical protein AcV7_005702 [Antrodia cinnamomea]